MLRKAKILVHLYFAHAHFLFSARPELSSWILWQAAKIGLTSALVNLRKLFPVSCMDIHPNKGGNILLFSVLLSRLRHCMHYS